PTDINGYSDVYQEIKGEITNEKVQYVIKKYKMLKPVFDEGTYSTQYDSRYYSGYFAGDYNIFEELYQKLKRDTTYDYKSRSISCFYDWYGWDGLFSYDYSTLFGVIIAIAICIFAVFKDKTGEMEKLIRTTHIGWKKVIRIKLIACILASYFCAILFSVMDITCFGLRYGLEGWNLPLYYVDEFRYTWFNGTVLEYLILWMMLRGLGIIIFAMVAFIVGEIIVLNIRPTRMIPQTNRFLNVFLISSYNNILATLSVCVVEKHIFQICIHRLCIFHFFL
ncbi:MAG: hypothetical protein K6G65_10775, partial [Lachnospiraceae bacterium]|nr:hypothetical protein [Lachnospiraceae bacterium]